MNSPVLYVAGPYTAPTAWEREQNIRRAEEVSAFLWSHGIAAICVHTMTRFFWDEMPEIVAMEIDLTILGRCDGIVLVRGWELSSGTQKEIEFAKEKGIQIYENAGAALDALSQSETL